MKITDAISATELRRWCTPNDWQGARLVVANWTVIALIFAGVALWTNPFSIVLGDAVPSLRRAVASDGPGEPV